MKRRVAVTGLGIISPIGNSLEESWEAAKAGKCGIGRVTYFDPAPFACQIAAEVKNFDADKYLEPKEQKKLDLFSQFALAAAHQAWEGSKLGSSEYEQQRMGCVLGIGIGGLFTLEKYHAAYLQGGPRKISPFLIPAMITNLGPGNVAMKYGLKGVNFTITSACASATHAIGEAYRMIASGIQDVVLTGGSESAITPIGIGGFSAMKALSTRNDAPEKASRPFDKGRDGFIMGEGAAILVLEPLEEAQKRGAPIYAEMIGYGASCDAYHITAPSEDGEGAVLCMKNALEDAGIKPEEVSYLNAHGTSTPANDITETKAIKQVFGAYANEGLCVSSTKSMTGHLLGAAGAVEACFSILAARDDIIPPTINLEDPEDGCDLDYVPKVARKTKVNVSMSNSFGFGGTNAAVIFRAVK